eukprot:PLAT1490.1.p1 GENE.PLAT1490.1~~PLAT1490.1.p1  ORF type:complete len:444 (+),score=139.98 PLAT1490.1:995-2326(+)
MGNCVNSSSVAARPAGGWASWDAVLQASPTVTADTFVRVQLQLLSSGAGVLIVTGERGWLMGEMLVTAVRRELRFKLVVDGARLLTAPASRGQAGWAISELPTDAKTNAQLDLEFSSRSERDEAADLLGTHILGDRLQAGMPRDVAAALWPSFHGSIIADGKLRRRATYVAIGADCKGVGVVRVTTRDYNYHGRFAVEAGAALTADLPLHYGRLSADERQRIIVLRVEGIGRPLAFLPADATAMPRLLKLAATHATSVRLVDGDGAVPPPPASLPPVPAAAFPPAESAAAEHKVDEHEHASLLSDRRDSIGNDGTLSAALAAEPVELDDSQLLALRPLREGIACSYVDSKHGLCVAQLRLVESLLTVSGRAGTIRVPVDAVLSCDVPVSASIHRDLLSDYCMEVVYVSSSSGAEPSRLQIELPSVPLRDTALSACKLACASLA